MKINPVLRLSIGHKFGDPALKKVDIIEYGTTDPPYRLWFRVDDGKGIKTFYVPIENINVYSVELIDYEGK